MPKEKSRPSRGLPEQSAILERLRSQGHRPHSLPSLEEFFAVPRDRAREFQNQLKILVDSGLARRAKGRKFVAKGNKGPVPPERTRKAGPIAPARAEGRGPAEAPVPRGAGKRRKGAPVEAQ